MHCDTPVLSTAPVAAGGPGASSSRLILRAPEALCAAEVHPDDGGPEFASERRPIPPAMRAYQPLFDDLCAAIARRARAEQELADRFPPGEDERQRELQFQIRELSERRETELADLQAEFARRREEAERRFDQHLGAVDFAHREALREIERVHNDELRELEEKYQSSTWVTSSVLDDDSEESPKRRFERYKSLIVKSREEQVAAWTALQGAFNALVEEYGWQGGPPVEPTDPPADRDAAHERFHDVVQTAEGQRAAIERQWLTKLFQGQSPLWLFLGLATAAFVPLFLLVDPALLKLTLEPLSSQWAAAAAGAACGLALLIELIIYLVAAAQRSAAIGRLQQSVAEAGWVHQKWLAMARDELQARTKEFEVLQRDVVRQREAALQRFQSAHAERRDAIEARRDEGQRLEETRHHEQRRQIEQSRDAELREIDAEERQRTTEAAHDFGAAHVRLQQELDEYTRVRQRNHLQAWQALKRDWEESFDRFRAGAEAVAAAADEAFPPWEALADGRWRAAESIPGGVCYGRYAVDLGALPGAISRDPRLVPRVTRLALPALLPFPNDCSLLLKFRGQEARGAAVAAQQTVLLRLLTLLPPGTLRLTILDPVGLGESFAGLMHLADYDEKLVTSRIWTETSQIEARLADLTEHMENVFQKYLRNEFATIEEYNRHAGEVAEPYHFLVVSDFPAKFSDVAARRLTSIITSGPRCGVYTLLSVDLAQDLPASVRLGDLQEQMQTLTWRSGAFRAEGSDDRRVRRPRPEGLALDAGEALAPESAEMRLPVVEDFLDSPLQVDPPPAPELFTSLVRMVGRESKDARRVEVSFARIAPKAGEWWREDSRREIDVPLGRAGATKLQHVRLGTGTSQHMLVAGKTGSGKSTFLHALITNVALHYSPEEVRFYLIDFKKGVEFKDYASCGLPHADVIAIESDREFGVSALQKLDAVLQERGELFRRHGVQDIAGYRNANRDQPLPRILLVVDEFQEFFIEDDKLSQTASLLLDRLVRQGRAFGMHVILGSQTLGGAYSLARSTLGQVAVRVALQCSEADAHLILSESNTAARLLSRPGEAIYNDANGLLEGNHPFQIAWLSDDEREEQLRRLAALAQERGLTGTPPIVFEGNIAADPARNGELVTLLRRAYASGVRSPESGAETGQRSLEACTLWLGESVDIGPPTSVTFHRQGGNHLLVVGNDSEAAFGVLATSALALAAQVQTATPGRPGPIDPSAADAPAVWVFDGSPPGSVEHEWWETLCEESPAAVRLIPPRQAAEALRELAAERERRAADPDAPHLPRFVLVYNLSKFRDLRKGDDDYGFSSFGSAAADKPDQTGKLLADLVAQGPDVGMHLLVWCDSAGNVERWFSRQTLKEFEQRAAFQMNASDSSNLIDTPAASKLGVHRALLYREETGTSEKFRPYGPPSLEWLKGLRHPAGTPAAATPLAPSAAPPPATGMPADDLEIATDLDAFFVT